MSAVRTDLFLDPRSRLTEQERSLMTGMLTDLVQTIADEFVAALPDSEPANDQGERVVERLWSGGLLDIPDLIALLLRRAQEERITAAIRAGRSPGKLRFLQSLVSDEDSVVSAAAMALILARSRRRDRFDGPRIAFDDVSAEAAVALVNAIAAVLRSDLAKRAGPVDTDERLAGTATALLASHDEGNRIEAGAFELVHALDRAGRLDESLTRSALEEGEIGLFLEALGRRGGISFDSAWEWFTGGPGGLAKLLRIGCISRGHAGEVIALTADLVASDAETEIAAFDTLSDEEVDRTRKWLRLNSAYRSAIRSLETNSGQRSV